MSRSVAGLLDLLGRIALCTIFLMSALGHDIPNFNQVTEFMGKMGIPAPAVLLAGAIVFLVAGSVLIIVGYQARWGALLLFLFLIPATYYFHAFWNVPTGQEQVNQMNHFLKNVSMAGAMLMIMANGVGPWSVDARRTRLPVA